MCFPVNFTKFFEEGFSKKPLETALFVSQIFIKYFQPTSSYWSNSIPPANIRKPLAF